jgi:hypothetical protein
VRTALLGPCCACQALRTSCRRAVANPTVTTNSWPPWMRWS